MAKFESKLHDLLNFYQSDESRSEVATELNELTRQVLDLAPAFATEGADLLSVSKVIRLSPLTSYAYWSHHICFVITTHSDTVGQQIPSSLETQDLCLVKAHPDSFGYDGPLSAVIGRAKTTVHADKYSNEYTVQDIATILVEMRSTVSAMATGEFIERW